MNHPQKDIKAILGRINVRMVELGMQPADLNRLLDMSPGWFHNIEKREGKSLLNYIDEIARVLKCNPIWLLYGDEYPKDSAVRNILQLNKTSSIQKDIANGQTKDRMTSWRCLIAWHEVHRWDKLTEEIMQDSMRQRAVVSENYNKDCFPMEIVKDSMTPTFNEGDFIVVDPHEKPYYGAYVILRLRDTEENILCQYFEKDDEAVLNFLNALYPQITKKLERIKVIGVVKECNTRKFFN